MENGMLIGNNGKKSLPDTLPNLYHGKKDAYMANGLPCFAIEIVL
jgi:hypothetical protein